MALFDKYRFEMILNDGTIKQIEPVNNSFIYSFVRDRKYKIYRQEVETDLLLKGDDYKCLYDNLEGCGCEDVEIKVYRCCGRSWIEIFSGLINKYNVDWNEDLCQADVKLEPLDQYTDFFDCWEDEHNILDAPTVSINPTTAVTVEQISCSSLLIALPLGFDINDEDTWGLVDDHSFDCLTGSNWFVTTNLANIVANNYNVLTTWTRLTTVVPCDGGIGGTLPNVPANYILISDDCATLGTATYNIIPYYNEYIVNQNSRQNSIDNFTITFDHNIWAGIPPLAIDNGVRLEDALRLLLDECNFQGDIVSDFFCINKANDCPDNIAYQYADDCLKNLILFQKTDITKANADQNATIGNISIKDLLDDLINLFNLCFWIDENGDFRLEHVSCNIENVEIDLEDLQPKGYKGNKKYDYEGGKSPQKEIFTLPSYGNREFEDGEIFYARGCRGNRGKNEDIAVSKICTDLEYLMTGSDEIGTDGFVLVALKEYHGELLIANEIGSTFLPTYNEPLSWNSLLPNLWLHDRYDTFGLVNGTISNLISTKKNKRQNLNIVLPCSLTIGLNPRNTIKTSLGNGCINNIKITDDCQIEIELTHDCL